MAETTRIQPTSKPKSTNLVGLLREAPEQKREFRKRKSKFTELTIHHADVDEYIDAGWEVVRHNKKNTRIKKIKPHAQALEDRMWCLLYQMGYPYIGGSSFTIEYARSSGTKGKKQIDAFAFDHETAFIVECKSKHPRGRRSLQKDLHETSDLMDYLRKSIFSFFNNESKPKLIWVYSTNGIIWSDPDIQRAEDSGIEIITENELQYYEAFLKHMGSAGRYQLVGHFLDGKKISGMEPATLPAISGTLGSEQFYSFVATPRELLKISFVNHQALNNPTGRPAYQRMVNGSRIKAISQFIEDGGYFPTNILLNFSASPRFDPLPNTSNSDPNIKFGWLTLPQKYCSAWVIDGQHRLYGYSKLDDAYLDQRLFVVAFENMDTVKEADLFITINHKQKSVPRGLLITLLSDLKMTSNDPRTRLNALASMVIRQINNDKSSPLFQKFAQPDVPAGPDQPLTISESVKGLVASQLLGRAVRKSIMPGALTGTTDPDTLERARRVINGYFDEIRSANVDRWEAGRSAYICVNPGIRAHFLLVGEILRYLQHEDGLDPVAMSTNDIVIALSQLQKPLVNFIANAKHEEIEANFSRQFGEGGVRDYFYNLCEIVSKKKKHFGPPEFKKHVAQRDDERVEWANRTIINLTETISSYVLDTLKRVYGTHDLRSGDPAFWELGIKSRSAKDKAYKKQQQDDPEKRLPKEAYLDILDLKEIVESKENWEHFQLAFNIPMPEEKKGKKYYTAWMAHFNELRRIPAHKNQYRTYSDEDFEFLSWLESEFNSRIGGVDAN